MLAFFSPRLFAFAETVFSVRSFVFVLFTCCLFIFRFHSLGFCVHFSLLHFISLHAVVQYVVLYMQPHGSKCHTEKSNKWTEQNTTTTEQSECVPGKKERNNYKNGKATLRWWRRRMIATVITKNWKIEAKTWQSTEKCSAVHNKRSRLYVLWLSRNNLFFSLISLTTTNNKIAKWKKIKYTEKKCINCMYSVKCEKCNNY